MAEKLAELYVDIEGRLTKLESALATSEKKVKTSADKIQGIYSKLGRNMGAIFGGLAIAGAMKKAFDGLVSLDKGMRQVNTIARLSEKDLASLTAQVTELSSRLGVGTGDLTWSLYQTLSAGIKAGDAMKFLETATKAGIAGITSTESAVMALTNVINAWGLSTEDATEISDVMFRTIDLGQTTFEELSASLSQVSSLASASGISYQEIFASIATLTKMGAPTAEAFTRINSAIFAMNEIFGDGWSKTMTLQEAMVKLAKSTNYSSVELQKLMGRKEGVLAVLSIASENGKLASQDLDKITHSTGMLNKAFEEMEKSYSVILEKLKVTVENKLVNTLGRAVENVGKLVDAFNNLPPWVQTLMKVGGAPFEMGKGSVVTKTPQNQKFTEQRDLGIVQWGTFSEIVTTALQETTSGLKSSRTELEGLINKTKEEGDAVTKMTDGFDLSKMSIEELERKATELETAMKSMTPTVAKSSDEFKQLNQITKMLDLKKSFEDAQKSAEKMTEYIKGITDGYEETLKKVKAIDESIASSAGNTQAILLYEIERGKVMSELVRSSEAYLESLKKINEESAKRGGLTQSEIDNQRVEEIPEETIAERIKREAKGGELGIKEVPEKDDDEIRRKTEEEQKDADERHQNSLEQNADVMQIMLGQAQMISGALSLGAHTFVSQLASALSLADQIAQSILSIISIFTPTGGFGVGGLISTLFGKKGGTFQGGKKIASFASGGDFIVPPFHTQDNFPMYVSSGERVRVTPQNKVSEEVQAMKNIGTRIEAMNQNLVNMNSKPQVVKVPLVIKGRQLGEAVLEITNDMTRNKINAGEF